MGNQVVTVLSGECKQLSLSIENSQPNSPIKQGVKIARVYDTDLNIEVGRITDTTYLEVCEGTYNVKWNDNSCLTITVDIKTIDTQDENCHTRLENYIIPEVVIPGDEGVIYLSAQQISNTTFNVARFTATLDPDTGAVTVLTSVETTFAAGLNHNPLVFDPSSELLYGFLKLTSDSSDNNVVSINVNAPVENDLGAYSAPTTIVSGGYRVSNSLAYLMANKDGVSAESGKLYTWDPLNPGAAMVEVAGFVASGPSGGALDMDLVWDSQDDTMYYLNTTGIWHVTSLSPQTEAKLLDLPFTPLGGAMAILGQFLYVIDDTFTLQKINKVTGDVTAGPTVTLPNELAGDPGLFSNLVTDMAEGLSTEETTVPERLLKRLTTTCCHGENVCYLEDGENVEIQEGEIPVPVPVGGADIPNDEPTYIIEYAYPFDQIIVANQGSTDTIITTPLGTVTLKSNQQFPIPSSADLSQYTIQTLGDSDSYWSVN